MLADPLNSGELLESGRNQLPNLPGESEGPAGLGPAGTSIVPAGHPEGGWQCPARGPCPSRAWALWWGGTKASGLLLETLFRHSVMFAWVFCIEVVSLGGFQSLWLKSPTIIPGPRPRLSSVSLCPPGPGPAHRPGVRVADSIAPGSLALPSTAQSCWECACLRVPDAAVVQTSRHGPSHRQQLALQRCSQEGGEGLGLPETQVAGRELEEARGGQVAVCEDPSRRKPRARPTCGGSASGCGGRPAEPSGSLGGLGPEPREGSKWIRDPVQVVSRHVPAAE